MFPLSLFARYFILERRVHRKELMWAAATDEMADVVLMLRAASEKGHADACCVLGQIHSLGHGVKSSDEDASKW